MNEPQESAQAEFDAIKDHLEGYVAPAPTAVPPRSAVTSSRNPTRHISHLTQMAAKALHRDVPGMAVTRPRGKQVGVREKVEWDVLGGYEAKGSWKLLGMERGMGEVDWMRGLAQSGSGGVAELEKTWGRSWDGKRMTR